MTPEQLLRPRYKVIAPYPGSDYEVGDVICLTYNKDESDEYYSVDEEGHFVEWEQFYKYYPHLFRRMQWWEERRLEDMPKYVKWVRDTDEVGRIEKVIQWSWDGCSSDRLAKLFNFPDGVLAECFLPATEQEYLTYINSKP